MLICSLEPDLFFIFICSIRIYFLTVDISNFVTPRFQSRKRIQDSDDDSDEPVAPRRLRRKRKSGQGRYGGNEVTSGFDRHRMVSSGDDSSDSDRSETGAELKKKSKNNDNRNKRLLSFLRPFIMI